jgi:hypothetical protein
MVCPMCSGSGGCPYCSAMGRLTCSTCNGTGTLPARCPVCGGSGVANDGSACPACSGTGTIQLECVTCNGVGSFPCPQCNGSGKCKTCGGTGQVAGPSNRGGAPEEVLVVAPQWANPRVDPNPHQLSRFGGIEASAQGLSGTIVDLRTEIYNRLVVPGWDLVLGAINIRTELYDFVYGAPIVGSQRLEDSQSWDFHNHASTPVTQVFNHTKSSTLSARWSVTVGVNMTVSASFGIPAVAGGSVSTSLSFAETQEKTESYTTSDSNTTTVQIPPFTDGAISVRLFVRDVSVPWNARVIGSGGFAFHRIKGFTKIESTDYPIGQLFMESPHPYITVVDMRTIRFNASGMYLGVQDTHWDWDINGKPLPPARRTQKAGR